MKNRIRYFRKQRGLTLGEVSRELGTTPQTVSRLETGAMTLSIEWLGRLADVLQVRPSDLLEDPQRHTIPVLGSINGRSRLDTRHATVLYLDLPARDPVAAYTSGKLRWFHDGDILIFDKCRGQALKWAEDQNCLVMTRDNLGLLCRVVASEHPTHGYSLVPFSTNQEVLHHQQLRWAARLIMRITPFWSLSACD